MAYKCFEKDEFVYDQDNQVSPLHEALWEDNLETFYCLVRNPAIDVNRRNLRGETPMVSLLQCVNVFLAAELVTELLLAGADANIPDKYRNTPLHHVSSFYHRFCTEDWIPTVHALVNWKRSRINLQNKIGQTPLHLAREKETAEILLRHGADVAKRDYYGNTPLQVHIENHEICQLLMDYGADVFTEDMYNISAFQEVVERGLLDTLKVLLNVKGQPELLEVSIVKALLSFHPIRNCEKIRDCLWDKLRATNLIRALLLSHEVGHISSEAKEEIWNDVLKTDPLLLLNVLHLRGNPLKIVRCWGTTLTSDQELFVFFKRYITRIPWMVHNGTKFFVNFFLKKMPLMKQDQVKVILELFYSNESTTLFNYMFNNGPIEKLHAKSLVRLLLRIIGHAGTCNIHDVYTVYEQVGDFKIFEFLAKENITVEGPLCDASHFLATFLRPTLEFNWAVYDKESAGDYLDFFVASRYHTLPKILYSSVVHKHHNCGPTCEFQLVETFFDSSALNIIQGRNIPSLVELSRNKTRNHLANTYACTTPNELYLLLKRLNVANSVSTILTMSKPLYPQVKAKIRLTKDLIVTN